MWTESTMDIFQSFIVSGLGVMVVFSALVAMALAIVVVTKVFSVFNKDSDNKSVSSENNAAANNSVEDEETFAVLMSVISEEMHAPIDSFRIKEIKEVWVQII